MNSFDSVIEEIFGNFNISNALGAAKASYTTDIRSAPSLIKKTFQDTKELQKELPKKLEQKKIELKFITSETANKALQETKTTITGESSTAKIFPSTAVIMEKVGELEGLMGEIVDVTDPLMTLFSNQLTQLVNQDEIKQNDIDIKNLITQNGTFWVKLTNPKFTNENFNSIVNYQYDIINEAVNPQSKYATWFVFETDNSTYLHKFKITKAEYAPDIKLGKAFRLDDRQNKPTGLLQVGQGTLYPRWYFLNDFTEEKGPLGIKEPEKDQNYSGDVKIS